MQALSLRTKFTLALLTVGVASAVLVGLVARQILLRRFDEIQMRDSFNRFQDDVVGYFEKYGSWDNGARQQPFGQYSRARNQARGPGPGGRGRIGGPPPDGGAPPEGGAAGEDGPPPQQSP